MSNLFEDMLFLDLIKKNLKKHKQEEKQEFIHNESYKHKYAKEVIKEWNKKNNFWIKTNYDKDFELGTDYLYFEYPIVVTEKINSIDNPWSEIWYYVTDEHVDHHFIPTYEDCKKHNLPVIAIIDIALIHKGSICGLIEICHTNPVSDIKLEKIKKAYSKCESSYRTNFIELDADWILNQTDYPNKLNVSRWFNLE